MNLYLENQDIKMLPTLELRLKFSKTQHGKWTAFLLELPGL